MFFRYTPLLNWDVSNKLRNYLDGYIDHEHQDLAENHNCTGGVEWILNVSHKLIK